MAGTEPRILTGLGAEMQLDWAANLLDRDRGARARESINGRPGVRCCGMMRRL
jgi:hypothetical protein